MAIGNRLKLVPHPQADGMALLPAVFLACQIDSHLGHVVPLTEIIMPHQAVEIHGRGQADVTGVVGHLGHFGQVRLEVAYRRVRSFQRRSLVEVEHQQQFVLVVERQHFQRHAPHRGQSHCPERQQDHDEQEAPSHQPRAEQRGHQRIEQLVQQRLFHRVEIVRVVLMSPLTLGEAWLARSPLPLGEG